MIIGIDEVGRGAWAGSMLFCAVTLSNSIDGLADSKKLSKKQRQQLASQIKKSAKYIGYGWVTASEIDDYGLTKASKLACQRALKNAPRNAKILIDGKINFLQLSYDESDSLQYEVECVVGGDGVVAEISAASIVAKVTRDEYMAEQAKIYPFYGFERNVGYGTKKHLDSIKEFGFSPLHRLSYKPLKDILNTYEA